MTYIIWDYETWSPIVKNVRNYPTKCTLHFRVATYCDINSNTAACEILAKGENEELKYDGTIDNNLRYVGANPNNYVSFNNELWKIIGFIITYIGNGH